MSHCWNQDGSEFSTVCVVVIAVGIFTTFVSIFCVAKIFQMAKRIRQDHKNNITVSDQIELKEYAIHIEPKRDDPNDITIVESSIVTTEESGNTTVVAGSAT